MPDILVIAPHPDDAEIHCGASIAAWRRQGASVGVIDASRGELGSRGDALTREREAAAAAAVLGLALRENLGLPDGAVPADDAMARNRIVDAIRRHRPRVCVALSGHARHPDHINLAQLVRGAVKAAALHRLAVPSGAAAVAGLRLWYVEAELPMAAPAFLLPCSAEDWERKRAAIACYASQLAGSTGPETSIAAPSFLTWIEARGRCWGQQAEAAYAEAFDGPEAPRIMDLRGI